MRSVTAAASRQARVVFGGEDGREWPQPEEENEEDGKRAPHLELMVHEALVTRDSKGLTRGSGIIDLLPLFDCG